MTSAISIFRIFRIFFDNFSNFRQLPVRLVRSKIFHQTAYVAAIFLIRIWTRNFIKIRAILAIFWPLEDLRFSRRALSATCINYWELCLLKLHCSESIQVVRGSFGSFSGIFGGRSVDYQRRQQKKYLIQAAQFGRLDQMLRTTERSPKN